MSDIFGYIKVGISKCPENRIKQLQTGHPSKLILLFEEEFNCNRKHLIKIEKEIHKTLRRTCISSRSEWFRITKDQLEGVKNTIIWHRIRYEEDKLAFNSLFK